MQKKACGVLLCCSYSCIQIKLKHDQCVKSGILKKQKDVILNRHFKKDDTQNHVKKCMIAMVTVPVNNLIATQLQIPPSIYALWK